MDLVDQRLVIGLGHFSFDLTVDQQPVALRIENGRSAGAQRRGLQPKLPDRLPHMLRGDPHLGGDLFDGAEGERAVLGRVLGLQLGGPANHRPHRPVTQFDRHGRRAGQRRRELSGR